MVAEVDLAPSHANAEVDLALSHANAQSTYQSGKRD